MENTDIKTIQWFPGHMAKTRRAIVANINGRVDIPYPGR